jgi:hypothetical protein
MADKVAGPGAMTPSPDNPKGHWERWEIVDFHDRILGFFNRGYYTPFHDFGLPVAWWADPRVAETRREIVAFLDKRMGAEPFGFKDPRTVRLMPIWHQITKELKLAPKIIYCLRNPAQVARSLHARDGIRLDLAEYRWLSYNIDFFRYTRGVDLCTIEYETWFDDSSVNLKKLREFLQLPDDQPQFDIDMAVSEIVDNELRHDDLRLGEANQPLIRSVYQLARRADHNPAARDRIQDIAVEFLSFQQVQRAFHREFEQAWTLADQVPALSEKSAALQALVDEREAQLTAISAQAQESAARAAETLAALERQKAASADLIEQRDALALSAQGMRSEIARSATRATETLTELERQKAVSADLIEQRDALALSAQGMRSEIARSATRATETLTELERQKAAYANMVEHRDALALSAEDMRSEIARLSEALAAAQLREEELERIRKQVAAFREAVLQAEREARERGAVEAAIQADMANAVQTARGRSEQVEMLKSELAHAREVGRAILQALAASRLATGYREPRLGWRHSLRRLFGLPATHRGA